MTARTAVKALVVLALAAPLVGGLVGSSPAEANGTITSPPQERNDPSHRALYEPDQGSAQGDREWPG